MKQQLKEFPITIYGQIERYNDILSKARCRIFYKYENRNGTFITDEFADKLISSLPYVPVKGIYENGDYTDHGDTRQEGRIYGIVPSDPNFAWENHIDSDGIERSYACADVLIFTALYPEAEEIVGKAQSMELYEPSIKYHMAFIKGQKYLVFDEGCFLGLQALGENVEPCFEGASFYTLQKSIEDTIQKIKDYSKVGGQSEMRLNFKLSDSQKLEALWTLLNPECDEEHGYIVECNICEVFDDYALIYNYGEKCYERVYYTKNDEQDSIELGERMKVYVLDVTEDEKNTIETLRKLNGDTFELVQEELINAEKNANECVELGSKIEELNTTIATLNTEATEYQEKIASAQDIYTALQQDYSQLQSEVEALRNYKLGIEKQQKLAVIEEYTGKLSEEILATYKDSIDEYTVLNLDKELAYELKQHTLTNFEEKKGFIPKEVPLTGIEQILSHYEKK